MIISTAKLNLLKWIKNQLDNLIFDQKTVNQKLLSLKENKDKIENKIWLKEKLFFGFLWWRSLINNLKLINQMIDENEQRQKELTKKINEIEVIYKKNLFDTLNNEIIEFRIMYLASNHVNILYKNLWQIESTYSKNWEISPKNAKILDQITNFYQYINSYTQNWIPIEIADNILFNQLFNLAKKTDLLKNLIWKNEYNYQNEIKQILSEFESIKIQVYSYLETCVTKIENQLN